MLKKSFKKRCSYLVFIFLSMISVQGFADVSADDMYFLAITGVVAGGVVAYALMHHASDIQKEYLLQPTGPYAVGFQDFRLVQK